MFRPTTRTALLAPLALSLPLAACKGDPTVDVDDKAHCCYSIEEFDVFGSIGTVTACTDICVDENSGSTLSEVCENNACAANSKPWWYLMVRSPNAIQHEACSYVANQSSVEQDGCANCSQTPSDEDGDTGSCSDNAWDSAQYLATFQHDAAGGQAIAVEIDGDTQYPYYDLEVAYSLENCGAKACDLYIQGITLSLGAAETWDDLEVTRAEGWIVEPHHATMNASSGHFSFPTTAPFRMNLDWDQEYDSTQASGAVELLNEDDDFEGWHTFTKSTKTLQLDGTFSKTVGGISYSIDLNDVVGSLVLL